jgi:hypothetical protein
MFSSALYNKNGMSVDFSQINFLGNVVDFLELIYIVHSELFEGCAQFNDGSK